MTVETIIEVFSEGIPNYIISRRIGVFIDGFQEKIRALYDEYLKNVLVFVVLNMTILAAAVVSKLFFFVKPAGIILVSALLFVLAGRALALAVRNIIRIINNRDVITVFISLLIEKRSLKKAIRKMVRIEWRKKYSEMTGGVSAAIHSCFSDLGMMKSAGEIENEVVGRCYGMIQGYLLGNILYKVLAVSFFYCLYAFMLRPYVFFHLLNMRFTELMTSPLKYLLHL
jgi:hypothetical protein